MPGPSYHGRTHGVADNAGTYLDTGTDPITGLVDALNAIGGGASGIQYEIENDGAWLDVTADSAGPTGYAIHLDADVSNISTPGILLESVGYVRINSGDVKIGNTNALEVTPSIVTIGTGGALYPREVRLMLANNTTTAQGSKVVIYNANGDPIFEVRDDDTFHIKTGATWVADL